MEHHNIPYKYIESLKVKNNQEEGNHGYEKLPRLLELNPKGLVPTLNLSPCSSSSFTNEHDLDLDFIIDLANDVESKFVNICNDDGSYIVTESIPCMEVLNELAFEVFKSTNNKRIKGNDDHNYHFKHNLFQDSEAKADALKFDKSICSIFYKILMKPTREEQKEAYKSFTKSISEFLSHVHEIGYFKSEQFPTCVDYAIIPWLLRIVIIEHYRPTLRLDDYMEVDEVRKLRSYIDRMRRLTAVKCTLWKDEKDLLQAYERYADGTAQSQVGQAVMSGKNAHDV